MLMTLPQPTHHIICKSSVFCLFNNDVLHIKKYTYRSTFNHIQNLFWAKNKQHDFHICQCRFSVAFCLSEAPFWKFNVKNFTKFICHTENFCNSGKLLLVPYTKDFGIITRFWGNDLATVQSAAFYLELLSSNSFLCTKIIE